MEVVGKQIPIDICKIIQQDIHMLKCLEHKFPDNLLNDIRRVGKKWSKITKLSERKIGWMSSYISICRILHG